MSRSSAAARSLHRLEALPIIAVFALLLFLFMVTAPTVFLKPNIYMTFMSTLPPLILLSIGLTFVIGAGEIDLSFPSVIAFFLELKLELSGPAIDPDFVAGPVVATGSPIDFLAHDFREEIRCEQRGKG